MQCPHCFREVDTAGVCPFCGYDGSGQEKKYPLALRPGSILNGRYILGHVLGQGGFGITYIALDDQTKERVAIKEYFPAEFAGRTGVSVQVYSDDRAENFAYGKEKFLEEAKTLAAFIGNENIVRIYSYFEENDTAYLSMEYVDGLPLDQYMAASGGRLSPAEAGRLLLPLTEALETVHRKGIVHRDIAPDNILVNRSGTAKLIDFGAARNATGERSRSLDVVLKHGFAPYEQYMRRGRQGPWTDVYALAATWYYAITGEIPPEAVERRNEDGLTPPDALDAAQREALMKALAVSAADRYQSMAEFRRAMLEGPDACARETKRPREQEEKAADAGRSASGRGRAKAAKLPLILAAAAVLALAVFGAVKYALPARAYRNAAALLDAGEYARAAEAFEAMGDYRDAPERAADAVRMRAYAEASALAGAGQYAQAAEAFAALGDYRDAAEQAESAARMRDHLDASKLLEAGDYEAAYALLEELGDRETIAASRYDRAMGRIAAGDYAAAYLLLDGIVWRDSAEKLAEIKPEYHRLLLSGAEAGSRVFFGAYEQDNDESDGREDIEWLVLAREGDRLLVISRYALDCQPFDTASWNSNDTWASCTLRTWLNGSFLNAAFSAQEQARIPVVTVSAERNPERSTNPGSNTQDRIFLLNIQEAGQYFSDNAQRQCGATAYAKARGCSVNQNTGNCWWWLRSPGYYSDYAADVDTVGTVHFDGHYAGSDSLAVRPALWIGPAS